MAIPTADERMKNYMNKVELAWKKWKDDAVKEAEKDVIENVMKKFLAKMPPELAKTFDWSTGLFGKAGSQRTAGSQQQRPTGSQQKPAGSQQKQKKERTAGSWTTKELADYLSNLFGKAMTPKDLRRILRTMDRYNDHVTTHYSWTGQNDPAVAEVVEFIKGKKGKTA